MYFCIAEKAEKSRTLYCKATRDRGPGSGPLLVNRRFVDMIFLLSNSVMAMKLLLAEYMFGFASCGG